MMVEARLNNEPFSVYKAKILSYEIGACSYKHGYVKPADSMLPVLLTPEIGMRSITLLLDFEGDEAKNISRNITKFIMALHSGAELSLPDGFMYFVIYKSSTSPKEKAPWIHQVKITMTGYRHGDEIEKAVTQSGSFVVEGDYETPAIIQLRASSGSFAFFGINFDGIATNTDLVIDGVKKTVMQANNNAFARTDITKFPTLKPGKITVTLPSAVTQATFRYKPIYL